jgi:hypothetical protein
MNPRRRALVSLLLSLLCLCSGSTAAFCQQPQAASPQSAQTGKPLTNLDITRMVKGGFTESVIINTIASSDTQFDVSLDALFRLKEAGVSQRIIEAMQSAAARKASTPPAFTRATPSLAAPLATAQLTQPYVLYGGQSKTSVTASSPTIIQTKAKGDSVPALLADSAVKDIAGDAIISAAARTVLSSPGIAALPIIGMAGMAVLSLPKVFGSEPTYTFVYALGGRHSQTDVSTPTPRFEMVYSDVIGANPDEFEPALLKVSPTDNNWRMVGAQKAKAKQFQSNDPSELNFIEERIPVSITKLERGRVALTPQQPLASGEYALVLRPSSRTHKVALKGIAAHQGDGLLLGLVWDFSVPAQQVPAGVQPPAPAPQTPAPVSQAVPAVTTAPQSHATLADPPKMKDVPGGVSFQTTAPYDRAYEAALNVMKRDGYAIESASRETGQIKTEMAIEHGAVDIGRYVVVTVIREADLATTIRVEAYKQGRRINEQWQQRVGTKDKAQKLADSIQAALSRRITTYNSTNK